MPFLIASTPHIGRALRRAIVTAALGALAVAGAVAPASAQIEIKLGHVGEPGSLFQVSRRRVREARECEARRQGKGHRRSGRASWAATRR